MATNSEEEELLLADFDPDEFERILIGSDDSDPDPHHVPLVTPGSADADFKEFLIGNYWKESTERYKVQWCVRGHFLYEVLCMREQKKGSGLGREDYIKIIQTTIDKVRKLVEDKKLASVPEKTIREHLNSRDVEKVRTCREIRGYGSHVSTFFKSARQQHEKHKKQTTPLPARASNVRPMSAH